MVECYPAQCVYPVQSRNHHHFIKKLLDLAMILLKKMSIALNNQSLQIRRFGIPSNCSDINDGHCKISLKYLYYDWSIYDLRILRCKDVPNIEMAGSHT